MKLVKIDDYTYVNPESIGAIKNDYLGTNIYLTGSDKPIETSAEIKKVLDAICGSEEHLIKKSFSIIDKNGSVMDVITSSDYATVTLQSNNEFKCWKLKRN